MANCSISTTSPTAIASAPPEPPSPPKKKGFFRRLRNILLAFVRPRNQEEWALAYCQSHLYVEYLIKNYGIESVGPMLDAFHDGMDTAAALQKALAEAYRQLQDKKPKELVEERLERLMAYGRFKETADR